MYVTTINYELPKECLDIVFYLWNTLYGICVNEM